MQQSPTLKLCLDLAFICYPRDSGAKPFRNCDDTLSFTTSLHKGGYQNIMTRPVVFLMCLTIFATAPAKRSAPLPDDVLPVVEEYDRAWNAKDASTAGRFLASDYVYFSSKGQVQTRQPTLDMLLSPKYILASAERSEMKVYRQSDTAVVSSRWRGHGSYDGKEFRDDQRCSIVLVRQGHGWQVLSEHCTQIVE